MTGNPALLASVGVIVLSASGAIGAYWARLGNPVRRTPILAALWLLATAMFWRLSVNRVEWAGTYPEIFFAHVAASIIPASVAFAVARRGLTTWLSIIGRVVLIALIVVIVSVPAAFLTGCLLDTKCY
jgi:hypothetical protein